MIRRVAAAAGILAGAGSLFDLVTAGPRVPHVAPLVSHNGDQIGVDFDRITAVPDGSGAAAAGGDVLSVHPKPFNAQTWLTFAMPGPVRFGWRSATPAG